MAGGEPVEPMAEAGYWRTVTRDKGACRKALGADYPYRQHRYSCYVFLPCEPSEACLADNICNYGCVGV
jgi:hypothetical protein